MRACASAHCSMRAAVGLILLCARPTVGSGPAAHDAHLAGLERIKRLEATVQALVAGQSVVESDGQGRRLQTNMDHGGMHMPMGAPTTSPTPAPAQKPAGGMGMDMGADTGTDMGTSMPTMHASLFFFAPDASGLRG